MLSSLYALEVELLCRFEYSLLVSFFRTFIPFVRCCLCW